MAAKNVNTDDMERQPLVPGGGGGGDDEAGKGETIQVKRSTYNWLVALLIIAVLLIVGLTILAVFYVTKTEAVPEEEAPGPATDLLPFAPPEAWNISAGARPNSGSFNVTEATWVNLDVSPDGADIVFDVLGGIYRMSIAGGEAEVLYRGIAFNTQPRYAPDGQSLLFRTNEGGCDNVWRLDLATGAATPLTEEPYRFVSSAQWHPSGQSFVGVKWHTTTRSIPAGEIWTFTLDPAGANLPVVSSERLVGRSSSSAQVGPEEPAFSSDGESVYYSQNTADGASATFAYNKDPNAGIYSIYRVNVATKATTYITGGAGGAARPTPSRNGAYLAFVRRTRFTSSLVLFDIETANEVILYSNLSEDQQEASAPSGVYPQFAWTPNDDAIVIWARGGLLSIRVNDGVATPILFTARVTYDFPVPARASVDASTGATFSTKVAQWPSPVPSTPFVLFTAVGRTYTLNMGTVVPTTGRTVGLEFGPSAAPNGRQFAHVVWTDVDLGLVEIVTLDANGVQTGNALTMPLRRGRYANPTFSLEGDRLVVARLGADALSGPLDGSGSGLYVVDLQRDGTGLVVNVTGPATRVGSGAAAVFIAGGQALLVDSGSSVSLLPLSPSINGGATRTLLADAYATSMVVNPTRSLLGFIEFNRVYIAQLPSAVAADTTPTTAVGVFATIPSRGDIASHLVGVLGGDFLSWSNDGSHLRWVHGPTHYDLDVLQALQTCADETGRAFATCAEAFTTTTSLVATVTTKAPTTGRLLIHNATVLTMETRQEDVLTSACVLIEGSTILSVTECPDTLPENDYALNAMGGVVTPGFIDAHAHWSGTRRYYVQRSYEFITNLAFGVTTMHNPSLDTLSGFVDAELVRSGQKLGPRLHSTGTIVYGADGNARCEINSLQDARDRLNHLKAYGGWSVKSYNQPCRSSRQQILQAARELGFSVVPEGGMAFYWNLDQMMDGHTTIEHNLPVAPVYEDVRSWFAASGVSYCPTLVVSYGGISGERYWYQEDNVWEDVRLQTFHPKRSVDAMAMRRQKADDRDYHHIDVATSIADLYRRGVHTTCGAHGQRHGLAFHWEMWMFAQGGMTSYEVLRSATRNAAEALGLGTTTGPQLGVVAAGAIADLLVWPADRSPLVDIRNTAAVAYIVKDGRLFLADRMDELYPTAQPLPPGPVLDTPVTGSATDQDHIEL